MLMEMLVLGYGNIGSVTASDLAESLPSTQIVIAGRSKRKAEEIANSINRGNVVGAQLDATDHHELVKTMKKSDIVVGALPGNLGYKSMKAAVEARVDMVDVSYMPENPLALDREAAKAGVTIVPDCGVAPGISNVLIGHIISKLNKIKNVFIMVGGLPENPVPPLGYTITWSAEGLIDEYTRRATIVRNGEQVEVEPLSGLEEIEFPGVGKLESFYTDGLRTLIHTIKDATNMWEKTLRYPGHVEKVKLLKALGFLDEHKMEVDESRLAPRALTARLFESKLQRHDVKDILALKVEVTGTEQEARKNYTYHLLDRYDEEKKVTAMARTTGYPASIVAQLIAGRAVTDKGVVPLERLGAKEEVFEKFTGELEKRKIEIVKSIS